MMTIIILSMFIFNPSIMAKIGARDHHHYCIITHGGKIIVTGYNKPVAFNYNGKNFRRHAECDALLKLPFKYHTKKIRMYVIRKDYKNSKPCQHCLEFILKFRVKNIYYSDAGCLWDETVSMMRNEHISFRYIKEEQLKNEVKK